MDFPYPPSPEGVPVDLATPSRRYRLQVWASLAALCGFLALYFGLLGWCVYLVVDALRAVASGHFEGVIVGLPALVFALVLAKGLFVNRQASLDGLVEVDEQKLLAFVHRVADEAGAARPNKVYLTPGVNAAVFYDQGLKNLVLPTKKNLLIGLGLINTLTLDEFKAVLGHEFGHFGQSSMKVGSWVYQARDVVADLITRRDAVDVFLEGLSRFDLRIAWIGWIMRLLMWSLRSVLATVFAGVMLVERALSRQMEFHADLVAVSLTGSDSLIHALWRLHAADDVLNRAISFAAFESQAGRPPVDVYALQTRFLERLREVHDKPSYGATPERPEPPVPEHRVFTVGIAEPPQMWSSHPPNDEREAGAKARYVPSPLDARSAWLLFADPEATRAAFTALILAGTQGEETPAPVSLADSLAALDAKFVHPQLARRYRGAYLDRTLTRRVSKPELLWNETPTTQDDKASVLDAIASGYPADLRAQLEAASELALEAHQIKGLRKGVLQARGGILRFRGNMVRKGDLARLETELAHELHLATAAVDAHDRDLRTAHLRAARLVVGGGWDAHLTGLLRLLHYAEHNRADLEDAIGVFHHVWAVATADGQLSDSEIQRVVRAAGAVQQVLARLATQAPNVSCPGLELDWPAVFQGFHLPNPTRAALADGYLSGMAQWTNLVLAALSSVRANALLALLVAEDKVADALQDDSPLEEAPVAARLPIAWSAFCDGAERTPAPPGLWDRFINADGALASTAQFGVAGAILLPVLFASAVSGRGNLVIVNGLCTDVVVSLDGVTHQVPEHGRLEVGRRAGSVAVRTETAAGLPVEQFVDDLGAYDTVVYNVASALDLQVLTVVYGSASERAPKALGTARWFTSTADHVLDDPPASISTKGSGDTRSVVAVHDWVAAPHAAFDPAGAIDLHQALRALGPAEVAELATRRAMEPETGPFWHGVMLELGGDAGQALCANAHGADPNGEGADAAYLSARCAGRPYAEVLAAYPEHVWSRGGHALDLAALGQWQAADDAFAGLLQDQKGAVVAGVHAGELIRVRRMVGGDVDALATRHPAVAAYLERMEVRGPEVAAFLDGTLSTLDPDQVSDYFRWLEGASVGASPEAIARALTSDPAEAPVGVVVGLMGRERPDTVAVVLEGLSVSEKLRTALQAVSPQATVAQFEAAVDGLMPYDRSQFLLVGILWHGERAPPQWHEDLSRLTFVVQRPRL